MMGEIVIHDVTGIGTKRWLEQVAFPIPFLYQKVAEGADGKQEGLLAQKV